MKEQYSRRIEEARSKRRQQKKEAKGEGCTGKDFLKRVKSAWRK